MDSGPLPSAGGSKWLFAESTLGPRSHHAQPRTQAPQEGDASSGEGVHAGPASTSSLRPCLEVSTRTHQPLVQTEGIHQSSMGSSSARPPNRIPTARQPAVGVMVMEQDSPPPLILVNRHRTDGGHGAGTADTSWITGLNGLYDRGKALWLN
eukprot:1482026-Rhodomonas_salina.1